MPTTLREARYIKADVKQNNNKFWYITENDNSTCLVQFGRVGGNGAAKTHSFPSQPHAARFYESKCREKEGDRKGYRKLQVIDGVDGVLTESVANHKLERIAAKQIQSDCPRTRELIRHLTQANVHNILSATTMQYDMDRGLFRTPCGIVTKAGIDQARHLLSQISDFVARRALRGKAYAQILNDYLMLIPQKVGRQLDPQTLYPNLDAVHKQNAILDSLEASLQTVLAMPEDEEEPLPPKLFEVKLHLVRKKKEIARIDQKYRATLQKMHACAHLSVKTVYEVEIASMARPFREKGRALGNVKELWHGTQASNLLSILKSGFVILPSNAPFCTGRMFGNGVYFSDQSTKSLNYAYGYWSGGRRDDNCFMFLAEVALGKSYVPDSPGGRLPMPGFDSTFAQAGKSGVVNNEMIVYETSQINPRFLVEFAAAA
jgi:poly [ADP-ribose] polymerase